MKAKLGLVIGIALGTAIYQTLRHGIAGIDWYRVGFVAVFTAIVLAIVPRRWFERSARQRTS